MRHRIPVPIAWQEIHMFVQRGPVLRKHRLHVSNRKASLPSLRYKKSRSSSTQVLVPWPA
jgi:hypothetical protein